MEQENLEKTNQTEETTETNEDETFKNEEDVETLKGELERLKSDNENYKKALQSKKLERKLSEEKEEEEVKVKEETVWDDTTRKFQEETIFKAEKRALEVAQKASQTMLEQKNEQKAIGQFIDSHPEYSSDDNWKELISNLPSNINKDEPENVVKALIKAHINRKIDRGEFSEADLAGIKEAEKRGMAKANISNMSTVSKTSSNKDNTKSMSENEQRAHRLAQTMPKWVKLAK